MKSLFCVSDLHLCDRGPRDNFIVRGEERFFKFLDYVQDQNGELYVLGDLFDWWQCNLSASVLAYEKLLGRLANIGEVGALWIAGNHDSAFTQFIGRNINLRLERPAMSRAFETTLGGKRFAFLHGHEADPYCSSLNPGTGEITAIISGMLEDRNKGPNKHGHAVEDSFIGTLETALNLWRKVTFQADRRGEMLDAVEAYRKEAGADIVIYGHTHEPGRIGTYHYNTGCWCRDRDTFVRIDDGIPILYEWTDGPSLFEGVLR